MPTKYSACQLPHDLWFITCATIFNTMPSTSPTTQETIATARKNVYVFGFHHHTTPLDIREKLAITPDLMHQAYSQLVDDGGFDELVIVSTCNRTEFYVFADASPATTIAAWLCRHRNVSESELSTALLLEGDEACRHLLRVASGLDSMVLGEPQIFGQIKSAYHIAEKCDALGEHFKQLFQFSFAKIKNIRSNIPLGQEPVSMAYTAMQLVKQIFERLDDKRLMLVGSGETVELVARYLADAGANNMIIANRTLQRAEELAKNYDAKAIALYSIADHLGSCDIVVSATASQLPILGKGAVEQAMQNRRGKTMLLLDLAVPRDIEAQVNDLDDVYLYCVDDFRTIITQSQKSRERAAVQAEDRIDSIMVLYRKHQSELASVKAVIPYRHQAEATRDEELNKAMRQLKKGVMPEAALYSLAHSLTSKLLHTPSIRIRKAGAEGRVQVVDAAKEIFDCTEPPHNPNDWSH